MIAIEDINDPRLAPYRELKDRALAERQGLFIAEGEHLVRRLLASRLATHSVLLAERRAGEIGPLTPADVPVYVVPQEQMNRIVGFKFHSGVIAAGVRQPSPTLAQLVGQTPALVRLVVCPQITSAENLGSLIRLSAGFGATAVLLGPQSIDPFMRQAVRVSMGTIFSLPVITSPDLTADLNALRSRWGVHCVASVLDESATPLATARRHDRLAILFGNEAQGLDATTLCCCDERVTIPMKLNTDSLNVGVAAGIFMYHYWS